jgi:hypothetical protein
LPAGVDYQRSKQQQQAVSEQQAQAAAADKPGAGGATERVQLGVFWQCLEVTFFHEHCLLLIRREAFRKDKKCGCAARLEQGVRNWGSITQLLTHCPATEL